VLLQHLGDGRRQRRLAVIDVTDRPHVHVRLAAIKLFLAHGLLLNPFRFFTARFNSGRRPSGSSPKTLKNSIQRSAVSFQFHLACACCVGFTRHRSRLKAES
jgi:hypothetical protein